MKVVTNSRLVLVH